MKILIVAANACERVANAACGRGTHYYLEDHAIEIALHKASLLIPHHVREISFLQLPHAVTEYRLVRAARRLGATIQFDVIHQPNPVSPRAPSFVHGQKVPIATAPKPKCNWTTAQARAGKYGRALTIA